jgi:hypothetical protein
MHSVQPSDEVALLPHRRGGASLEHSPERASSSAPHGFFALPFPRFQARGLLTICCAMRLLASGILSVLLLLAPAHAGGAQRCGDDVDGRGTAVRCDCGDLLVSSHTLTAADPITQHACPGTGLLVDVPAGRPGPTLSLGGQAIAGNGRGVGIEVVGGGDGGTTLQGPGTVEGFDTGVLAVHGSLARTADVLVTENRHDGFSVAGTGYVVTGCEAVRNGRDGFALRGQRFRVEGNRALENGRRGFAISGRDGVVGGASGNEASANARIGLAIQGRGHRIEHPVALNNAGAGIRARVAGGRLADATASGNRGDGLRVEGHDLAVAGGDARNNGRSDRRVRGARVREEAGVTTTSCGAGASCP